ncbi:hypothetical protein AWH04_09000 [Rhodococcus erythropolis]|jgi:hypothetical protein|nr:hypothetical protein AWH04_09000 [Rhodococcus erythropolis]
MSVTPWALPNWGLDENGAKSRYSLSFMDGLCAQAGLTVLPTQQDSDVHAIDMTVCFPESHAQVQLKCSSVKAMDGEEERIDLDDEWISKWSRSMLPVFIVLVVVPSDIRYWRVDAPRQTVHNAHAYWVQFDKTANRKSVLVPRAQRVTRKTLDEWHGIVLGGFGGTV